MTKRADRRGDALSKEKIVAAAILLLDAEGEGGLTFRALAARLATGSGAIYWHVADKGDLLAAATGTIITQALDGVAPDLDPRQGIRALALRLFDAIDAHPWVGAQVSREPWQPAMLRIFEGIGGRLMALGVPQPAWFDAWSVLVNYIFGVAGQNAANARLHAPDTDRSAALATIAARWAQLDAAEYPFLRQLAGPLRDHDDRDQFLAGLDLILAGIGTVR
ncbi:TetR/AcrR family transcriptional regulator [Nitrospirillum sp. BR 11828]|uniref:TetR/AcrR family transcriptional regulator n=1 Tax=Nitrospirillum sp. BR 11828 TaxID=3104325 RepID=UPI002ACA6447|nr:TetR/AcrR family transcriptional regulator C-terminal domain-containing protein [Nitrospirillum sp. BR 11828]MDZ5648803.1 TetR/AcrR family transcriptional regulator C-terminal domain-containing protein [Nitrospirillum sp. BR 11828]